MKRRKVSGAIASATLVTVVLVGCNSILDNTPGMLVETDASATEPTPTPSPGPEDAGSQLPPISGNDDAGTVTPPDDAGACPQGKMLCAGSCVSMTDPLYGCGNPACTPCALAHGSAACQGRTCVVAQCDPGFADCNKQPGDGCEVDLSKPTSCGACNAVCPPTSPVCAPSGTTFACGTGCTPTAPLLCGAECVDPLTSENHCGACNQKCPAVMNATTACNAGVCTFTCKAQFNACNGKCVTKTDPTACGPTCAVCPPAPNATPQCKEDVCTFTCAAGFADCNMLPGDGCESKLADDPANCGVCGRVCAAGTTCKAGACVAAPDGATPPPPPPP